MGELSSVKAEAQGTPHEIAYKGHTFRLPAQVDALKFSDAVLRSEEASKPSRNGGSTQDPAAAARLLRVIFGPEQYATLVGLGGTEEEVTDLMERATKVYVPGGLPESSASRPSS